MVLWPRQEEFLQWVLDRWRGGQPGICEKSRDSGVSTLCVALGATLCLFNDGLVIGFGSRKLELVDQLGVPKSLLEKVRMFLSNIPTEYLRSWDVRKHAPSGRIMFPDTGSIITGEGGDEIGRGDRASIYFLDEAAFLEHPEKAEAALSATTNCLIEVSTPNGSANPFHNKRFSGTVSVFTFHWRQDPRKSLEWYEEQKRNLDPVTVAQEIDIDYKASVPNQLLPADWCNACVDAHEKLGSSPVASGARLST